MNWIDKVEFIFYTILVYYFCSQDTALINTCLYLGF